MFISLYIVEINDRQQWWFIHLEVHALIGITRQTHNQVPHNQHKMGIHKPRVIH
jgi:hypothetical protein